MILPSKIISVALIAAVLPSLVSPAAAASMNSPHGLQDAVTPSLEAIQYRRGWGGYRGGGFDGPGVGLGIAGALIGGAIIGATQPYGPYGYYGNGGYYGYAAPGYPAPGYVAVAPPYVAGDAVAYCMQRFHSYDPSSGTYLGFDGYRHPCP
jgi:BA14K-like protein